MAHPILQYQPNLAPLVASLEWELPELAPLFGGTVVSVSLTPGCGPPPQPPTKADQGWPSHAAREPHCGKPNGKPTPILP